MSVADLIYFDKNGEPVPTGPRGLLRKLFLGLVIILVASLSFALGRLTRGGDSEPIRVEYDQSLSSTQTDASQTALKPTLETGQVYVSSKGKKYYYAHCSGYKRISEANLLSFASGAVAEASGYSLASGCKP